MSSIPHPPSTATRKRKPLSPARVYQAWAADVSQHGRRGAFRRVSELVGVTPEYVRQLVAKHEAAHTLKPEAFTAHELDYLPAPGELPLARPTQPAAIATKEATPSTPLSCDAYVKQDTELNVNSCETGDEAQLATDKQPQAAERENADLRQVDVPTAVPQFASAILDPFPPDPDPTGPLPDPLPRPLPPEPVPPIVERWINPANRTQPTPAHVDLAERVTWRPVLVVLAVLLLLLAFPGALPVVRAGLLLLAGWVGVQLLRQHEPREHL